MHRLIAILSILLVFGLPVSALAQESVEGVISGQVINGTEGGGSVAGMKVALITYINDVMAEIMTTQSDGEGKFQFDNVTTEHKYLVSTKYMEVDYYYLVTFESEETQKFVEVSVCDATTSDEAIKVGLAHTIVNVEEESLNITEVFWLVNDGDRTYVGTDGVLVFTLPEGTADFEASQELMPDYQLLDDNRVTYLVPFPPGERQLTYSYRLAKLGSDEFSIPLVIDYPTDSLELMVQGEGIEVAVSQLAPAEPVVTGTGERFIHFRGENLLGGTVVNIHLSSLSEDSGMPYVILWVIIAVLIASIAVYLIKRKQREGTNE